MKTSFASTPSFTCHLPDCLRIRFHMFPYTFSKGGLVWTKRRFLVNGRKVGVPFQIGCVPAHSTPSFTCHLPDCLRIRFHMFPYTFSKGGFVWTKRRFLVAERKVDVSFWIACLSACSTPLPSSRLFKDQMCHVFLHSQQRSPIVWTKRRFLVTGWKVGISFKIGCPPAHSTRSLPHPLSDSWGNIFHMFFYTLSKGDLVWTKRRSGRFIQNRLPSSV